MDRAKDKPNGVDPIGAARGAAGGALGAARDAAGEGLGAARDVAGKRVTDAKRRAASAAAMASQALGEKPRLRGVSHQWAFFVSLGAGTALVLLAPAGEATVAAAIYAFTLSALFGVSALYHRVTWSPERRKWMRRLDHTMIFLLIAGTYTPFALLVLEGDLATIILVAVWASALAGVILNLLWWDPPKPVTAGVYLSTGWIAIAAFPQLLEELGPVGFGLVALGGLLYTAGAVVYARRRPDPRPAIFGYHEIFHLLVIGAAALQFAAIAIYAIPKG